MPEGYRVTLGDGSLDTGDTISGGLVTFSTDRALGAGNWIWTGTWQGQSFVDEEEPGDYFLGTDGNVYFVPAFGPVTTLDLSTTLNPPAYLAPDGTVNGTAGDDVMDLDYTDAQGESISRGNDTIDAGAGNDLSLIHI